MENRNLASFPNVHFCNCLCFGFDILTIKVIRGFASQCQKTKQWALNSHFNGLPTTSQTKFPVFLTFAFHIIKNKEGRKNIFMECYGKWSVGTEMYKICTLFLNVHVAALA